MPRALPGALAQIFFALHVRTPIINPDDSSGGLARTQKRLRRKKSASSSKCCATPSLVFRLPF